MTSHTCGNLTSVPKPYSRTRRSFSGFPPFTAVLAGFMLLTGCETEPTADGGPGPQGQAPATDPPKQPSQPAPMTEDDFVRRTEVWRDRIAQDPTLASSARFFEAKTELSRVSNEAADAHLRANASLLLGVLYEGRNDLPAATAQYEHAAKLVPDDAGPYMALALVQAQAKRFEDAARTQKTATKLDPDNLENWLVLGELLVKSGDEKAGIAAYVDYETRRKGLIDGLTLKNKQGDYLVDAQERMACAEALASATDQGTAVALTYALKTDADPGVLTTVASVMGVQRLAIYTPALQSALPKAQGEVKDAIAWALSEIDRDPVEPKRPDLPPEVVEAAKGDRSDTPGAQPDAPAEAPPATKAG